MAQKKAYRHTVLEGRTNIGNCNAYSCCAVLPYCPISESLFVIICIAVCLLFAAYESRIELPPVDNTTPAEELITHTYGKLKGGNSFIKKNLPEIAKGIAEWWVNYELY